MEVPGTEALIGGNAERVAGFENFHVKGAGGVRRCPIRRVRGSEAA